MCGIVGYVGSADAQSIIVQGLEKLEYRGYDSAGIALLSNKLEVYRAEGKLINLKKILNGKSTNATCGIGHTRWATHGKPSEINAHPHTVGSISLIHNGIIENYSSLKAEMLKQGIKFVSETDTEVAAQYINLEMQKTKDLYEAVKSACAVFRGTYAFLAIDQNQPGQIIVAKKNSPVVIGVGEGENFIASDIPAILSYTRSFIFLEDGDFAKISADKIEIQNSGVNVERKIEQINWDPVTAQKGGYKHYMLKEINEQANVLSDTIRGRLDLVNNCVDLSELKLDPEYVKSLKRIVIIACGTASYAGQIAKFYFENLVGIPTEVDFASEFRYRKAPLSQDTLVIVISQSGETADTLAALEYAKATSKVLAICNVLGSTIARKADYVLYTHAGPEISVASTKAFLTQVVASLLLSSYFASIRDKKFDASSTVYDLMHLPRAISKCIKVSPQIEAVAKRFHAARDFLFIGRGTCYPIALEGALKLKEVSYIHAEGYPAGELKHGPIALVDENMPVVVILQRQEPFFEKVLSNLKEVQSRGGRIIIVTDAEDLDALKSDAEEIISVPFCGNLLAPIMTVIPLQLLAYFVAVINGSDVDLPRNLAKSVTVE